MRQPFIGRQFHALKVIAFNGRMATCVCDCGTQTEVWASNLYTGNTKSCGCLKKTADGLSKVSRDYYVWAGMLKRCYNERDEAFHNYGGRGIKVCEQWKESFAQFLADMGPRPRGYSIERINNNGNYEPSNCRWATAMEQMGNTRKNVYLTFRGRTQHLSGWARELKLPYQTLLNRMRLLGWSVEKAFTTPHQGRAYDRGVKLTYGKQTLNLSEWAQKIGKSTFAIHNRLKKGATMEAALSRKRFNRWHQIPRK